MASLVMALREKGLSVDRLDLGGGLGISYDGRAGPDIDAYAAIVAETVGHLGCKLTVEPGRRLVGYAGLLVSQVLYVKESGGVDIAIVDAAMNDLMRPALYGARHPVMPLVQAAVGRGSYQIVGPVCESTDSFGTFPDLPTLAEGDLVAFACAGAYGASMSSTYNARDLVPEVLVDGGRFRIVRRRQDIHEMMVLEADTVWQPAKSDGPRREAWR
jgi:diaminopimelate decarboxylase